MRTPKSLVAGAGAGTSIIAAGSIALASVSAIVGVKGWPQLRDAGVPRALALASELGTGAAAQAGATAPGILRIAGDAPAVVAEASGTASARRRTARRARLTDAGARRSRRGGTDGGGVAGTSAGARAARRGAAGPAGGSTAPAPSGARRTGVVEQTAKQATDAVRETAKQAAPAVGVVAPGASAPVQQAAQDVTKAVDETGATVQQTTDAVGSAVQQTSQSAGSAVGTVTQTAGSAVEQTTTTVTQAAGGVLRPR